jgi:hypothetical protein
MFEQLSWNRLNYFPNGEGKLFHRLGPAVANVLQRVRGTLKGYLRVIDRIITELFAVNKCF